MSDRRTALAPIEGPYDAAGLAEFVAACIRQGAATEAMASNADFIARQCREDAARIEALEAQLAEAVEALENTSSYLESMINFGCPDCGGDCSAANPPVQLCPMGIMSDDLAKARAALAKIKGAQG